MEGRLHENLRAQLCRFTAPPSVGSWRRKYWRKKKRMHRKIQQNYISLHFFRIVHIINQLMIVKAAMWRAESCGRIEDMFGDLQTWQARLDACFLYNKKPNHRSGSRCFFFFLLFNQRAQANLYLRRGGMKGNKMGSGTGTTDLGMAWRETWHWYARNTQNVKTTFNGQKPAMVFVRISPLSGLGEKLFQSSSLVWSSRDAVRNVLNGRSMRRLVGNDCFYWRQHTG